MIETQVKKFHVMIVLLVVLNFIKEPHNLVLRSVYLVIKKECHILMEVVNE
jgi:hypothetical protein